MPDLGYLNDIEGGQLYWVLQRTGDGVLTTSMRQKSVQAKKESGIPAGLPRREYNAPVMFSSCGTPQSSDCSQLGVWLRVDGLP